MCGQNSFMFTRLPVVNAPKPQSVTAMLALAPMVDAELMYMMIGEAVKAHAQLNRLSFCKLQERVSTFYKRQPALACSSIQFGSP